MNRKITESSLNIRECLKKRLHQNQPDPNRHLTLILEKSEFEIKLENVIIALKDNYQKKDLLQLRSKIINKFLDKALQILDTSQEWLNEIEQLINEYEKNIENIPSNLYYAKFRCLSILSVSEQETELYIQKAIDSETNPYHRLNFKLELAIYYENASQYTKMKKILLESEKVCRQNPNLDKQLAISLLFLGHYYFYIFQFEKASHYMNQAKIILETIFTKEIEKERKDIFALFNNCFHYLGRVYFAQHDFVKASQFYIEAQQFLEKTPNQYTLKNDLRATAFYHLRLGQALEACQLIQLADYHYQRSQKMLIDSGCMSGKMQISLIRANLIDSQVDYSSTNNKHIICKKQAQQIKEAAQEAKSIGYHRGYLEALLRLFLLYFKYKQFDNLVKVVFKIITAFEFYKFMAPTLLFSRLKLALGLYSMGPYYLVQLYQQQKYKPGTILITCPCTDPECVKRR